MESAPNEGSVFRFTVRLEVAQDSAVPAEASASRPVSGTAPQRGLRIPLVEDNATNRLVATARLEILGHRVDSVANGIEAVAAVKAVPYDLVQMDVMMPQMGGLAATWAIRALPHPAADLPIVALTANAFHKDEEQCRAAPTDGFLAKPLLTLQLVAVVDQTLARMLRPAHKPA